MMKSIKLFICASALVFTTAINAAIINVFTGNVDGTGQVTGATGVLALGKYFDVSFENGTCIAVFTGCDESTDFYFDSQGDAGIASRALVDQVFGGAFQGAAHDLAPNLLNGVEDPNVGITYTVWGVQFIGVFAAKVAEAINLNSEDGDTVGVTSGFLPTNFRLQTRPKNNWAVWTESTIAPAPVPEPSIIALFGLGLVGLGFARRKRQS